VRQEIEFAFDLRAGAVAAKRLLCASFSGGRVDVAIWLATWASVSDRRPKGGVGVSDCMSLPQPGKENLFAKTAPSLTRLLTVIRGSDSLSIAKKRRGLPGQQRFGAFSFAYNSLRGCGVRGSRITAPPWQSPRVAAVNSIAPGSHVPSWDCRNAS
jgi:hypothetical protein